MAKCNSVLPSYTQVQQAQWTESVSIRSEARNCCFFSQLDGRCIVDPFAQQATVAGRAAAYLVGVLTTLLASGLSARVIPRRTSTCSCFTSTSTRNQPSITQLAWVTGALGSNTPGASNVATLSSTNLTVTWLGKVGRIRRALR